MYTLIDAKKMNAEHPETFLIPSDGRIKALSVGDCVKLGFEDDVEDSFPERMWVEILKIDGDNFKGRLVNEPVFIESISYLGRLDFESKHIMGTLD